MYESLLFALTNSTRKPDVLLLLPCPNCYYAFYLSIPICNIHVKQWYLLRYNA
ncbi:hypothetical protein F3P51_23450 [Bacteroides fragilis]|uniref:Uncharacterized protein n=2 Tax=Bacteroides fragilis TaxID=817 RepID=A0A5C6L4E7_BACFG|nr:hypothetical protein F3B26_13810 [Bacteroides fragilis]BAD49789.1 hypothetical protein BF3043 [Bacteroides fragilis YCH46]KAA5083906.1 hypothetical protein F2Z45_23465 [Bacteroides fragilis]KAA5089145.1 hypothetical protein F2Z82_11175 [Bacteroides fragilis]KAA5089423.1 hypothetical protein F2Z40_06375 [Bacteroides fragilis]